MKSVVITTPKVPLGSNYFKPLQFRAPISEISRASLVISINAEKRQFLVVKDRYKDWAGSIMPLSRLLIFVSDYCRENNIDITESFVDYAMAYNDHTSDLITYDTK